VTSDPALRYKPRVAFLSKLARRARNAVARARAGQPRGMISPIVQNDLFHVHAALFGFFSHFVDGQRVLFDDDQAGFGTHVLASTEAVSATGILRSERARRYAERHYGSERVRFSAAPDAASYDVIITRSLPLDDASPTLKRLLTPDGKLFVAVPPALATQILGSLSNNFASVRRFVQTTSAPIDLASPYPSLLPPDTFHVRELGPRESVGPEAITLICLATDDPKWRDLQLHLGCGPVSLQGWINIDNQPYPGIDVRWDLARGIPFRDARYIFAEHFIEHLSYGQAETFLRNCRAALRDDGVLRLSTPNLDWVWRTSYHHGSWAGQEDALRDCFGINRAFHGWGHQFLYNLPTLIALLEEAGFASMRAFPYGVSDTPALAGIERHEQYLDTPDLPHILIVEARGRRTATEAVSRPFIDEYRHDVALR
jgi:predicted SAM-dependent methyltransferase